MKTFIGNSGQNGNVALLFYQINEQAIRSVREQLFLNLEKYHPSVAIAVKKLLDERIKNTPSPLIGELYPHILNGLVSGIKPETLKEVSAQWLAAYVLTIMIDNNFDKGELIDGKLIAPLHLEASKLQKKVIGTKYADMFEQLIFEAVKGQIKDTKLQKDEGHLTEKLKSAHDKNKILSAFSLIIASLLDNSDQQKFAISFTENCLLSFQMLDDIADFESDYKDRNCTYLLSDTKILQSNIVGRKELLKEVILSGNMQKTLSVIIDSLTKGSEMIDDKTGSASEFFVQLAKEVSLLNDFVAEYRNTKDQFNLLDKIDEQIKIVCQSS